MFPLSINGRIEVKALQPQHVGIVAGGIKRQLEVVKAHDISGEDNTISFRGGFFPTRFLSNLKMPTPAGLGQIELFPGTPAIVSYRLSAVAMLADVLTISMALATFIGITDSLSKAFLTLFCMFWALSGANYLIAFFRLRSFVKTRTTVPPEGPLACPACGSLYVPLDYRDDVQEKRCATCNGILK